MKDFAIWSLWNSDTAAQSAREQMEHELVEAARAAAMIRDMRQLREREKQYSRLVKESRGSNNATERSTAIRLRQVCREIINASQPLFRKTVDPEGMQDLKDGSREALSSYEYDSYGHTMHQRTVTVPDELRDQLWPPVLEYPHVAALLPGLSR